MSYHFAKKPLVCEIPATSASLADLFSGFDRNLGRRDSAEATAAGRTR